MGGGKTLPFDVDSLGVAKGFPRASPPANRSSK